MAWGVWLNTRVIFDGHRDNHAVLSTTRFPEAAWPNSWPNCAPQELQILLRAPHQSIDNMGSPRLMSALLTEGL
jgi:hypothetical protein